MKNENLHQRNYEMFPLSNWTVKCINIKVIPSSWRGYYSLAFAYHSPKSMKMKESKAEFVCNSVKYKCDRSKIFMQSLMQRFYIQSSAKYLGIIVLRMKFLVKPAFEILRWRKENYLDEIVDQNIQLVMKKSSIQWQEFRLSPNFKIFSRGLWS